MIDDMEAIRRLRALIGYNHGGSARLAKKLDVNAQLICNMHKGRQAITGKVAAALGLRKMRGKDKYITERLENA